MAMVAVLTLALAMGAGAGAAAAKTEGGLFTIPALDYPLAKARYSQAELAYFSYTLERNGVVAMTNIPGFQQAREDCLLALGACHQAGLLVNDALTLTLVDGTRRTTLASGEDVRTCPGLGAKIRALQAIVDQASLVFANALDDALVVQEETPLLMAVDNAQRVAYDNFSSIVQHGEHLDHFHAYEKPQQGGGSAANAMKAALERHADQGLFIAITPALILNQDGTRFFPLPGEGDGFEIELAGVGGALTKVVFPNQGNALVFMLGDGMTNWINKRALHRALRAVPHRLVMPSEQLGKTRLWFGRMFFPPNDAFLSKQQTTFAKARKLSMTSSTGLGHQIGCSTAPQQQQQSRQVLRDLAEVACGAGEIYCWMACVSTASVQCDSPTASIECIDPKDGHIWTEADSHCPDCTPQCHEEDAPTAPPRPPAPTEGVCNPNISPTNMFMNGFNGVGPSLNCVVFLFQPWVMNSEVKYAFGALGAFLVAFTVELMILLRRQVRLPSKLRANAMLCRCFPDQATHPALHSSVLLLFYTIQLVFAYFAMLLAMSFATVIFVMVMLGFVVGHFFFNFELAPRGNEACCNVNEPLLAGGGSVFAGDGGSDMRVPQSQQRQQQQQQQQQASVQQNTNCCGETLEGDSVDTA